MIYIQAECIWDQFGCGVCLIVELGICYDVQCSNINNNNKKKKKKKKKIYNAHIVMNHESEELQWLNEHPDADVNQISLSEWCELLTTWESGKSRNPVKFGTGQEDWTDDFCLALDVRHLIVGGLSAARCLVIHRAAESKIKVKKANLYSALL